MLSFALLINKNLKLSNSENRFPSAWYPLVPSCLVPGFVTSVQLNLPFSDAALMLGRIPRTCSKNQSGLLQK